MIMGHSQLLNICGCMHANISPQLLPCVFWLIGLTSRIKKQCFRLIRKIPFVGGAVSISGKSLPFFIFPPSGVCWRVSGVIMSHSWMTAYQSHGGGWVGNDRPLARLRWCSGDNMWLLLFSQQYCYFSYIHFRLWVTLLYCCLCL